MKHASFLILILTVMMSCKDKSSSPAPFSDVIACGVKDPAQNLLWLKKIIEEAKSRKEEKFLIVKMYEINKTPVFHAFYSYSSCSNCGFMFCDGSQLEQSKLSSSELEELQKISPWDPGTGVAIWPQK